MDPPDLLDGLPDGPPIPRTLHSLEEEGPFTHCKMCERPLATIGVYFIQKVIRSGECVFEFAICTACADDVQGGYSDESKDTILSFYVRGMDAQLEHPERDLCNFCATEFRDVEGYTLLGACRHESLLTPRSFICSSCEEELNGKLSKQTREEHDRFVESYFPCMPPSLEREPSGSFPRWRSPAPAGLPR